jgi:hypothetical protein
MKLMERVRQFARGAETLQDWLGHHGIPVHRTLAQTRADVCLKCPNNQQGYQLTDSVAGVIHHTVEIKNHLQLRVRGEKSLHTCSSCQCVLRLKVWVPIEFISRHTTEEETSQLPEFCWQRKEQGK